MVVTEPTEPKNNTSNLLTMLSTIILLCLIILLYSSKHHSEKGYLSRKAILMDTFVTIKAYGNKDIAQLALNNAFEAMEKVESYSSFHIETSELSKLNSQHSISPSASFMELLSLANKAFQMTDTYFDPSFALLQQKYGFYSGIGRLPSDTEINNILQNVGFNKVLQISTNTVTLASGSLLDFGGIAGGYAIEKAIVAMRLASCSAFFIDDGGDIWIEGQKTDGKPWKISVRDPRDQGHLAFIETHDSLAISTSGNYERFITVEGKKYGHIMNPKTGKPASHYQSVTVIASSPFLADIYSTTLFAMPKEIAVQWANFKKIPALMVTSSGKVVVNEIGKTYYKNIKL